MKPKTMVTSGEAVKKTPVPIACAKPHIAPAGFYSADRVKAPTGAQSALKRAVPETRVSKRVLNFSSYITVKVSLFNSFAQSRAPTGTLVPGGHIVPRLVNLILDDALRSELDREAAVMARGEDIMPNRRRAKMLGRYLSAQPAKIIRDFYSVRMMALAASQSPQAEQGQFYHDIINERSQSRESTVVHRHTESASLPAAETRSVNRADLERIANQVAQKVEKRMKLSQERSGRW